MNERDEAVIGELLLTSVCYCHLGRAFHRDLAFVGLERMRRQSVNESAAFDAADRNAPAVHRECLGQTCAERICGIAPQIFLVVLAVHIFLETERLGRLGRRPVRFASIHVAS